LDGLRKGRYNPSGNPVSLPGFEPSTSPNLSEEFWRYNKLRSKSDTAMGFQQILISKILNIAYNTWAYVRTIFWKQETRDTKRKNTIILSKCGLHYVI
jgi:hypothetical protein